MKVKFGDMTVNQTVEICKAHYRGTCNGCPLYHENIGCIAFVPPYTVKLCDLQEKEIELPDNIPSTDVEPVVHAHWVRTRLGNECSRCRGGWLGLPETKRCPDCGARMDEETKDG